MRACVFNDIMERLCKGVEGDRFFINVYLHSGVRLSNYEPIGRAGVTPGPGQPLPLVELAKDDNPPIYVDIDRIEAVELVA